MERLALIEVLDRDGHVRAAHAVTHWPLTLGRAIDNDVVLDDAHVAARHATLALDDAGRLHLLVGDTRNGIGLGDRRFAAGAAVPVEAAGATYLVGTTRLRLRLPGERLSAEQPLVFGGRAAGWRLAGIAALCLLWWLGGTWLGSNPSTPLADYASALIGPVLAIVGWCAAWALGSKLFQHHFAFLAHARVALPWLLGLAVFGALAAQMAFALSWSALARVSGWVSAAALAVMVWRHLVLLLPRHRHALAVSIAAAFVVGSTLMAVNNRKQQQRLFSELYMNTISLPALRVARAVPVSDLISDLRPVQAELADYAKDRDDLPDAEDGDE